MLRLHFVGQLCATRSDPFVITLGIDVACTVSVTVREYPAQLQLCCLNITAYVFSAVYRIVNTAIRRLTPGPAETRWQRVPSRT